MGKRDEPEEMTDEEAFGEPISVVKEKREGRRAASLPNTDDPSVTPFDQAFDKEFGRFRKRRRPHREKVARQLALRDDPRADGYFEDRGLSEIESDPELPADSRAARRAQLEAQIRGAEADLAAIDAAPEGEPDEPQPEASSEARAPAEADREPPAASDGLVLDFEALEAQLSELREDSQEEDDPEVIPSSGDETPDLDPEIVGALLTEDDPMATTEDENETEAGRPYMPKAKSTQHRTPQWILDLVVKILGGIDCDPCGHPEGLVKAARICLGPDHGEDDGLVIQWRGRLFFNCPYGGAIPEWTEKALLETLTHPGRVVAIGLLPVRADAGWFQSDIAGASAVCFIRGRVKFVGEKHSAPFASMLVLWGAEYLSAKSGEEPETWDMVARFWEHLHEVGLVLDLTKAVAPEDVERGLGIELPSREPVE